MWVRKFPSELKNDKSQARIRRKNPTIPVIIALVVSLVELLYDPTLSFFLITFASIFVIAYVAQVFFRDGLKIVSALFGTEGFVEEPMDICTTCFDVKKRGDATACPCGGTLEPLINWKWVDKA